jgi:arylsulfatase A-like enzyme
VDFFDGNGPFRGEKTTLYEGGIRVPLIVRWPGKVKAGKISTFVCASQDFMPTLAQAAGAKAPRDIDGVSIIPTLTGAAGQTPHEYLYWEHYTEGAKDGGVVRAVRAGNWKIVQGKPDADFELYDLAADPGESKNLIAEKPEIANNLAAIAASTHTPPRDDRYGTTKVGIKDYVR